jgi:hypothetical protein
MSASPRKAMHCAETSPRTRPEALKDLQRLMLVPALSMTATTGTTTIIRRPVNGTRGSRMAIIPRIWCKFLFVVPNVNVTCGDQPALLRIGTELSLAAAGCP